jgi:hypothetical protein
MPAHFLRETEDGPVKAFLGVLGFVGGFFVSFGMFAVGIVVATWFLAAEPVRQVAHSDDMDRLWTITPRKIDTASQNFERLPPANPVPTEDPAAPQGVDMTATASLQPETISGQDALRSDVNFAAHVEWCQRRYRSYRANDNSYTSYDGDDRPCASPYSDDLLAAFPEMASETISGEPIAARYAMDETSGGFVEPNHASECFARYRSYRPSDNSYQPYGGGPRQQCH